MSIMNTEAIALAPRHGAAVSDLASPPRPATCAAVHESVRSRAKRTLDVIGSLLGLLVLTPVLLVVALVLKIADPGPVLFRQHRVGLDGRHFPIVKFRTMRVDAEQALVRDVALFARYMENDCKLPLDEDPRVTAVGRFLRKSSLDELPQLWNVLVGDMSLVGPRAITEKELPFYGELAPLYRAVRPGMTGNWQVSGRSDVRFPERAHLETDYVTDWSFRRDVEILLRTVPAVLSMEGAH